MPARVSPIIMPHNNKAIEMKLTDGVAYRIVLKRQTNPDI